ncbi:hypothetical protein M422DRAFT_250477 [Sphaerobolus stellatus SS14]|uniref:Uncharacterized protein n=1 Tax=Sphaerobolus stellatus (strain SS14) TaxID=990650 RepID=A0A0C9UT78_SPHS4|nr:hypothetical protein M422DRAFT_250477 [Sphaerobolus stellatus SS14]
MPRRTKAAASRIKHLRKGKKIDNPHDEEQIHDSIESVDESFELSGPPGPAANVDSDSSFEFYSAGSTASLSTNSLELLSDDSDLQQEKIYLNFVAKMKANMGRFMQSMKDRARPSRYNKTGKLSHRMQKRCAKQVEKRTKALHAEGYSDIHNYFNDTKSAASSSSRKSVHSISSGSDYIPIVQPKTGLRKEEEEEILKSP